MILSFDPTSPAEDAELLVAASENDALLVEHLLQRRPEDMDIDLGTGYRYSDRYRYI